MLFLNLADSVINSIDLIRQPFCFTTKVVKPIENMKIKIFSVFVALALCVVVQASAQTTQYVTLTGINSFSIQTNQLVSVIGYDWGDSISPKPQLYANLPNGYIINLTPVGGTASPSAQIPQIVTGVTNIGMNGPTYTVWATFKIETPTTATVISNYVPADAIVIPASATGNVQIILESSPDLVNWTAASPGTYGASAGTNRFFRVRAAVTP
jgi:hypothetical protein